LKVILNILTKNNFNEIYLLFGCGWGNEYKDWTPYKVLTEEIENEINLAERKQVGKFGNDDLFIIIEELQTEIMFCHEMDIHVKFNSENKITNEIINYWELENYIKIRKNKNSG
jgi:hypothetical protein